MIKSRGGPSCLITRCVRLPACRLRQARNLRQKLRQRQRLTEQPALRVLNPASPQEIRLGLRLHALGDYLYIERLRHLDNVDHHLARCRIRADGVNEILVDLQVVEFIVL
jgi:hypothetical protein